MVHALEEIHRLLKLKGVLIDMHPVAEPLLLEIHKDGIIDPAGNIIVREWIFDYQQADIALDEIVMRSLFAVEREDVVDSLTYYDSVTEMFSSLQESIGQFARDAQSSGEEIPDAEVLGSKAEELMQAGGIGAELAVRERIHFSRLRPI